MKQLTAFAIQYSRVTVVTLAVIFIMGIFAFLSLSSREDPEITIRTAEVRAFFPGMRASQVENLIADKLEKKIKQIPQVKNISTTVKNGSTLIKVDLHDRYFNLEPIWQDLRNKLQDVKSDLPDGTQGPFVNDDFGRVAQATVAVWGDGYQYAELEKQATATQESLNDLKGISRIDIHGIQQERVWVEFDPNRLSHYGIQLSQIVQSLKAQNIILPGGSIESKGQKFNIDPTGNFNSVEALRNLQINTIKGQGVVYLQDIAQITRGYVEPPQNPVFYNGHPALILSISMADQYNIKDFGKELTSRLDFLKASLPVGMQMEYVTYQPEIVKAAISTATSNLYQTIIIVLLVVILFLGLRTGLLVGMIVPLSILASLMLMYTLGLDLQRMSIAAIIISLGLLVDNGIVIAEDIRRRIDQGEETKSAAIAASHTLSIPLLTSSLTTILAFMPLMLAENIVGEFVRTLGWVIMITLLSSWVLSITAVPALCCWFLKPSRHQVVSTPSRYYDVYRSIINAFLSMPKIIIMSIGILLLVSIFGLSVVTKQLMPPSDRNQFLIYLDLPAGTHPKETIQATRMLAQWLTSNEISKEVTSHVAYVGYGGPRFFLALSPPEAGDNIAFFVVNTKDLSSVDNAIAKTEQFIADQLPTVRGRVKKMWFGKTETGLVAYRISGTDSQVLQSIADQVESLFRSVPGTMHVMNDWQNPELRVVVKVDQARARRNDISSEQIAKSLSAYYEGVKITDYREGDQVIPIMLRGLSDRDNLAQLRTLNLLTDSGKPIPLLQVADFNGEIEPSVIKRYNQMRTVTVMGKHKTWQADQLAKHLQDKIKTIELPPGYQIDAGGEVEGSRDANAALFKYLPHCLIVIMILMVLQFNSFRRTVIIMVTIPLVLMGVVVGLLTTGALLSFMAVLGIFSLAGIIVNHAIVLIEKIDEERENCPDLKQAILDACLTRFRPIVMTTLTTILGLLPLIFFGGELWYPMGIVIAFGLGVGTILSLGFVPVLYYLLFRKGAGI